MCAQSQELLCTLILCCFVTRVASCAVAWPRVRLHVHICGSPKYSSSSLASMARSGQRSARVAAATAREHRCYPAILSGPVSPAAGAHGFVLMSNTNSDYEQEQQNKQTTKVIVNENNKTKQTDNDSDYKQEQQKQ